MSRCRTFTLATVYVLTWQIVCGLGVRFGVAMDVDTSISSSWQASSLASGEAIVRFTTSAQHSQGAFANSTRVRRHEAQRERRFCQQHA